MSRTLRWVVGAVVVAALVVTVGTYAYIHWISDDAPERLSLESAGGDSSSATVPLSGGLDGTWTPTSDTQVGYRVSEILFGQHKPAVGRTSDVTGTMVISGTTVSKVELTADMTTVTSDEDRRDNQFRGRIMDVSQYPTATFRLTSPITLPATDATTASIPATGELTLHGTTKTVTVTLDAQRDGGTIKVAGSIPIVFADYGIPNPSFGPVSTDDHGELELLVVFTKSS